MSLAHINKIIYNKYDEIYNSNNTKSENKISIEIENFIYELLEKYDQNKVMYFIKELFNIEFINYNEEECKLQLSRNDDDFTPLYN